MEVDRKGGVQEIRARVGQGLYFLQEEDRAGFSLGNG